MLEQTAHARVFISFENWWTLFEHRRKRGEETLNLTVISHARSHWQEDGPKNILPRSLQRGTMSCVSGH